jgi:hypothetical protein
MSTLISHSRSVVDKVEDVEAALGDVSWYRDYDTLFHQERQSALIKVFAT